jgi:hypothetical protein
MRLPANFSRRQLPTCFGALLLVALAACTAGPPVQEMSDARQAIAAAREAGAGQYAAAPLTEAVELLGDAERELQVRQYHNARRAAVDAKNAAFDALLKARSARDAAAGSTRP